MFANRPSHACAIATSPSAGSSRSKWARIPATAVGQTRRRRTDRRGSGDRRRRAAGDGRRSSARSGTGAACPTAGRRRGRSRAAPARRAAASPRRRCARAGSGRRAAGTGASRSRSRSPPAAPRRRRRRCGRGPRRCDPAPPRRDSIRRTGRSLEHARPGARGLAHHALTGAERIALRAAARPDAGAGRDPHVDPQRPRRQPRRLEAGAAPGHVLAVQRRDLVGVGRVVDRVAPGDRGRRGQPLEQRDQIARGVVAQPPDAPRGRLAVALAQRRRVARPAPGAAARCSPRCCRGRSDRPPARRRRRRLRRSAAPRSRR